MKYSFTYLSLLFIPAITLLVSLPAAAQVTDTTGTGTGLRGVPHVYKYDARSTALGEATVADPTNLSSININPAALSFVRHYNVVQVNSYQNWNNNLMTQNATFPVFAVDQHRFAGQLGFYHGGFNSTNPIGEAPFPEPDLNMYQFDLVYAYSLENVLSFGILNSTTLAQNDIARYWTNFTSLGLMYAPSQTLSYGFALRGLGRSVEYQITEEGSTTLGSQELRESIELGATIAFPVDNEETDVSLSLANEKRFGQNGIWYKLGLEGRALDIFKLRGGFLWHPDSEIFAPRFGVGIDSETIRLDYSISAQERLNERFHQLGITFNLD